MTSQAPKTSSVNFLKLEATLIAGNGIKLDMDNRKDFITHLSISKTFKETIKLWREYYYLG